MVVCTHGQWNGCGAEFKSWSRLVSHAATHYRIAQVLCYTCGENGVPIMFVRDQAHGKLRNTLKLEHHKPCIQYKLGRVRTGFADNYTSLTLFGRTGVRLSISFCRLGRDDWVIEGKNYDSAWAGQRGIPPRADPPPKKLEFRSLGAHVC